MLGDIWGGITGAAGWLGEQAGRAAGWVGGLFDGGEPQRSIPSLGRRVDLGSRLAAEQSGGGGSWWSRATDALGDVIEDVVVPLGGAVLGQMIGAPQPMNGGWGPRTPPTYQRPSYGGSAYTPGVGSMPAPIGGPATPLPSPTWQTIGPTAGAVKRSNGMLQQAVALPGGAGLGAFAGQALRALGLGAAGGAAVGALGLNGEVCPTGAPFRQTAAGVRANRHFIVPHPVTGEAVNFGYLGRCVLFSRDMSAARKVDRLARRARRTRRGR